MAKPEIRLKGFEGEWEIIPFSSFATLRRGLTYSPSDLRIKGVRVLRSSNIVDDTFVISKDDVFVRKDCVGIELAKEGDILITAANGSPKLVGKHCIIKNNDKEPLVHGGFMLLASSKEPYFLNASMSASWFVTFQKTGVAGGNGAIGNLSKSELEVYNFFIPKDKNERNAIAEYFKSLDSMLQSTTKKIESLKQMKQACLVSMFPQAGETTPRVRFKGFEGEWVKDKAVNLFMTFNERNRPDLPVLSANQDIRGMAPRSDTGYTISHNKANEVTYKVVKPGQYVIHLRSFQGGFAHSAVEGITSPAYTVFGFKNLNLHDDYFWKIIFMSKSFIKSLETITYGIRDGRSISFSEFSEMSFLFPSKQEQQKISTYFRSLDKQISLQEQKLEKLKQIKAACLDKMFV